MKTAMIVMVAFAMVMGAGAAQAATTTVALYRCGEDDHVNAGDPAGNTLSALVGWDATQSPMGGTGSFQADTAAPGSTLSLKISGGPNQNWPYTAPEYLNGRATDWGIEAWLKLPASFQSGVDYYGYSNGTWYQGWGWSNGWMVEPFSPRPAVDPALLGKWVHTAVVFNGGQSTYYLNKTPIKSGADNADWRNDIYGDLWIGDMNAYSSNCGWSGNIDDFRIFTFEPGQFDPGTDLGQDNNPAHAELTATPAGDSTIDFGDVPAGGTATLFSAVMLQNTGDPGTVIDLQGAVLTGPGAGAFSIVGGDPDRNLTAPESEAFDIMFDATGLGLGPWLADIRFQNDSPEGNVTYYLRGNVVPASEPAALGLVGVVLLAFKRRRS